MMDRSQPSVSPGQIGPGLCQHKPSYKPLRSKRRTFSSNCLKLEKVIFRSGHNSRRLIKNARGSRISWKVGRLKRASTIKKGLSKLRYAINTICPSLCWRRTLYPHLNNHPSKGWLESSQIVVRKSDSHIYLSRFEVLMDLQLFNEVRDIIVNLSYVRVEVMVASD